MSFAYVGKYGHSASYITEVAPPAPWPELAFIGRWKLDFDGFRGTLDIYHLPGIEQWVLQENGKTMRDRRIGAFYDSGGLPFKVNGMIEGNRIEFYIDGRNKRVPYGRLQGRKFVYYLLASRNLMSGTHTDADGRQWGGYAVKAAHLPSGTSTPRPFEPSSFVGSRWQMKYGADQDAVLLVGEPRLGTGNVLQAEMQSESGGGRGARTADVTIEGNQLRIAISGLDWNLEGRHLSHEGGLVAGTSSQRGGPTTLPFYMVRQ
jgi:hypothetical protein